MFALIFSVLLICDGAEKQGWQLSVGWILLVALWMWARFSSGAESFNGIGIRYLGKNVRGGVITKWITAIIPLIPVRSYLLAEEAADDDAFDLSIGRRRSSFEAVPFRGLGLDWGEVLTTWSLGLLQAGALLALLFVFIFLHDLFFNHGR
jgi:hypothetical protein